MSIKYNALRGARQPHRGTTLLMVLIALIIFAVVSVIAARVIYASNLQPVSDSPTSKLVTVEKGMTVAEISELLSKNGLIRSAWAFEWYVRAESIRSALQAGLYDLRPNQSVPQIVAQMTGGRVAADLFTILPGERIDQIRAKMLEEGFSASSVDEALKPNNYKNIPIVAVIPDGKSLEGFLYPDSYQQTADTTPKEIIEQALRLMDQQLTEQIRSSYIARGLTVYEGVTLASIVGREVAHAEDMGKVAQVFLSRLKQDKPLESDPTAFYGAIIDGEEPSLLYISPYNTYTNRGLPPTPINNMNAAALQAVANPSSTDYLYFVAGDDGTTHFARTLAEHEANTAKYCTKLCGN